MSELEIQQGSGVCVRCFISVADLERHDWSEHGLVASPERRRAFAEEYLEFVGAMDSEFEIEMASEILDRGLGKA